MSKAVPVPTPYPVRAFRDTRCKTIVSASSPQERTNWPMSINILNEQVLSMAQAARVLPTRTNGKPLHVGTLYRWVCQGLRGVRLETVRIGDHMYTSREALQRFVGALTDAAERRGVNDESGTAGLRDRRRNVDAELARRLAPKKG